MSREAYNSLPAVSSGARSPGGRANRRITELPTVDRSPSRDYGKASPIEKNHNIHHNLGRKLRQTRSSNSSPLHGPIPQIPPTNSSSSSTSSPYIYHHNCHQYNHHQYYLPTSKQLLHQYQNQSQPNLKQLQLKQSQRQPQPQQKQPHKHHQPHNSVAVMGSPYYRDMDEPTSPGGGGGGHHRSRSASRPPITHSMDYPRTRYQSLDRGGLVDVHDREFIPIREPRDRSRDRSLERGLYLEDELYGRSARQSPNTMGMPTGDRGYLGDLQHQHSDLQRELGTLKRELELTNQKLGSSMHSIKTFWSPELKKERALRKEESAKYSLINDQLKLLNSENQKQAMLVRQLEEELRLRMRQPNLEMQTQIEGMFTENEHLNRELSILRDTIKELELRIETQKQTLNARDESIKKLLEMLQNKGMGKEEERQMFQQMQAMAQKQHLDEFRLEIQRRDQEIMAMAAKMKTLDEQHQDYQRHIAVLKESLCAKEEHYTMLQADVEELRTRLEEKNRLIEKKTQSTLQAVQDRNRMSNELTELKDHMDIKDRKINVLQRKLNLNEANQKMQYAQQQAAAATAAAAQQSTVGKSSMDENQRKQIEEQLKQMEEYKKQLDGQAKAIEGERKLFEDQRKQIEAKRKDIEEKEKKLIEFDRQLQKRKEQMDQLEKSLQKAGGTAAAAGELNKQLTDTQRQLETIQKEYEKAKEEVTRSQQETERLLQVVQMTQEEQNAKEKTIMDLQQALKNAQAKLKTQAQQQQQQENFTKIICENVQKLMSTTPTQTTKTTTENQTPTSITINTNNSIANIINENDDDDDDNDNNRRLTTVDKRTSQSQSQQLTLFSSTITSKSAATNTNLNQSDFSKWVETQLDHRTILDENFKQLQQFILGKCNAIQQFEMTKCEHTDRIQLLENALRESVVIVKEREDEFCMLERLKIEMCERIKLLEQKIHSLQNTNSNYKCCACRNLKLKLDVLKEKILILLTERREKLQELTNTKQEILEMLLSEKDTQIALLEVSGAKTQEQIERLDRLRSDRFKLNRRLKVESESSLKLLSECKALEIELSELLTQQI